MKTLALCIAAGLCSLQAPAVLAQSSCNSDRAPVPAALFERFVSADCEDCWHDPKTPAPGPSALVVDWIVPTAAGDEAPLSAAAAPDALARLHSLARAAPTGTDVHTDTVAPRPGRLRVAVGPAFNDYIGGLVRFTPPRGAQAPYRFWLVLVEGIPAGSEGSPVARRVVRNVFHGEWPSGPQADLRPLRIPDNAQASRLGIVGWVQDARGRTVAAAQALCPPQPEPARR